MFAIFFIPFILFIGGILFLIIYVIRKSSPKKSPEFTANEKLEMEDYIYKTKVDLSMWPERGFIDITSNMNFRFSKGFANKLKGKIRGRDGQNLVTFTRVERGMTATGYMFASTSHFDLYFELKGQQFSIDYNGFYLGEIMKDGTLLDQSGKEIGHAKHPKKVSIAFGTPEDINRDGRTDRLVDASQTRLGEKVYPLIMNGRLLANINVSPDQSTSPTTFITEKHNENSVMGQIIHLQDENYTEEEEKWLNALSIFEVAFHGHWMI